MSSLIACYPALLINISLILLLVKGLLINGCSTILSWPWQIWLIFVCPVVKSFTKFKLLNDDNVLDLVKKSAKKFCALNPLLTTLVIECIGVLLPIIKQIRLPSLTLGRNPRWILCWKSMAWIFYLKVTTQLVTFLVCLNWLNIQHPINQLDTSPNGLFPVLHLPYRQHYNAKTALLKVKSDILMNMNKGHITLLVLLDLSGAFDTIDHGILLKSLQSRFRVSSDALTWFSSYLNNRSQCVSVSGLFLTVFPCSMAFFKVPALGLCCS